MSISFKTIYGIEKDLLKIPINLTIDPYYEDTWIYKLNNTYDSLIYNISSIYNKYALVFFLDDKIILEHIRADGILLTVPLIRINGKRPKWKPNISINIFKKKTVSLFVEKYEIIIPAYSYKSRGFWKPLYNY